MKIILPNGFNEDVYEYVGTVNSPILYAMAGVTFPDPNYEIENHKFPAYSIEYIYDGDGAIQQDGYIQKVKSGDFVIIHPGYVHYYSNPKNPWKKVWLHISGDTTYIKSLMDIFKINDEFLYIPQLNTPLELENILEIVKRDDFNTPFDFTRHVFFLFQEIDKVLKSQTHNNLSPASQAKNFIDKRIKSKLTISEIAEYLSISPDHLCRLFKKEFGTTPTNYIRSTRIEQSKILLKETNLTTARIAEHLFFYDKKYFGRVFTEAVGMPPSEYRKQNRQ